MKLVASSKYLVLSFFIFLLVIGFLVFRFFSVVKPFQSADFYLSPQSEEQPSEGEILMSFSVIGDPENDLDNLKKSLDKSQELNAEFAVIVGDLTQTGTPKEFKQFQQVQQLKQFQQIEHYLIPGNHDLWYQRQEGVDTFRQYFGQRYYAREIKGYQFIFLDNGDEWIGFDQDQLNWLGHYLFESEAWQKGEWDNQYLVFTHIPFWHPETKKAMGEYEPQLKDQAYEILQKLCQHPPLAIFSGHLHKVQEYNYGCANDHQIRMINAGSINETRNWQLPRFLKVEIFKDGLLEMKEIEL